MHRKNTQIPLCDAPFRLDRLEYPPGFIDQTIADGIQHGLIFAHGVHNIFGVSGLRTVMPAFRGLYSDQRCRCVLIVRLGIAPCTGRFLSENSFIVMNYPFSSIISVMPMALIPPSIVMSCPLIHALCAEARYKITSAISDGCPGRPARAMFLATLGQRPW